MTGEFTTNGYWAFPRATNVYPNAPNNGTEIHAGMVSIPATATVVYSRAPAGNGVGSATSAQFSVVNINPATGLLSAGVQAVFSDGFSTGCRLTSSSATELLCYDGTVIRRYLAANQGSNSSRAFIVYNTAGTLVNTFTATGAGAINGVYFDWWVGRYSAHDGYGARTGGSVYGPAGSDTHCFSPVSSNPTLL